MPVTPGSRGAPPGRGSTRSPWGTATTCASQVCAQVCVCACRSSRAALLPSCSPGGASRGEKGPVSGKKPQTQWEASPPEPSHTHGGQGQAGSPAEGAAFLPVSCSSFWAESNSGLEQRDFLTPQQRVMGSSYRYALSPQAGDGSCRATCAGFWAHTPGQPLALRKSPQGRGWRPGQRTRALTQGWALGAGTAPPAANDQGGRPVPAPTVPPACPPPLTCLALPTQKVMEWKWTKRPRRG